MRRNSLLATGMLLALLATSACSAATDPNSAVSANAGSTAGSIASDASAEVGASQLAAAEKAKAVASKKAEDEAAEKAKAEVAKKAGEDAARKAAEAAAAEKAKTATAELAAPKPLANAGGAAVVAPAPAPAKPAAPAPVQAASSERVVSTTYATAYTWYDNTPAGSATISHPILHKTAGGTGTYEDPITIAVGHSLATGQDVLDFPAGTRIYLPNVRRYFIVEDTCGDGGSPQNGGCHQGTNVDGTNSTIWIDMWIGGQSTSSDGADSCAGKVTGVQTAVFNPASNYAVAPGVGVIHDGKCDAGYGNELVRQ